MLFWAGAILSSLAVWAALGVAATTFGLPLGRALAYAGAVHLGFGILSPIVSGGSLATIHLTRLLLWPFQLFAWLGISWGLLPPPP